MADPPIIVTDPSGNQFHLNRVAGRQMVQPVSTPHILNASGIPVSVAGRPISSPKPLSAYHGMRRTAADVQRTSPEIRNPLLNVINFFLPYNYKVLNQWIRYYDKFHPMVGNCIDMHGQFPISRFELKLDHDDPSIRQVYEDMHTELDSFERMLEISREYELIGEVFPYLHWSDDYNFFDAMLLMNPDFIDVSTHALAYGDRVQFELEPDDELKDLVSSADPKDMEIVRDLDPVIVRCVESGINIPIDNFNMAQIARKSSPYEARGTSIVLRALKDLLYEDKLREAQYSVADGLITPKQIWKLGDPQNGYMPNDEDLQDFRILLQSGAHDPNFAVITHYALTVDYIGANGKVLPIVPEFQFVEDRILTALYTNKAMTHGEGPTWGSGPTVAFEVLQGRYMAKRERLEDFFMNKVHIPVALANGFYKPVQRELSGHYRVARRERELALPSLEWKKKLRLMEDVQQKQFMLQLRQQMGVSFKRIADVFDLDAKKVEQELKDEEGGVFDPIYQKRREQELMAQGQMQNLKNGKPGELDLPGSDPDHPEPGSPPPRTEKPPTVDMTPPVPPVQEKKLPAPGTKEPLPNPLEKGQTGGSVVKLPAPKVFGSGEDRANAIKKEKRKAQTLSTPPSHFYSEDGKLDARVQPMTKEQEQRSLDGNLK